LPNDELALRKTLAARACGYWLLAVRLREYSRWNFQFHHCRDSQRHHFLHRARLALAQDELPQFIIFAGEEDVIAQK
jgi:hypothetical protein